MNKTEFVEFPKLARLSREVIISEKIDGTNAQIFIEKGSKETHPEAIHTWLDEQTQTDFVILAGSRTRWITPENDNFGFAAWAYEHRDELLNLGTGRHFGEWWGQGIQRNYGLKEQRWSLFNTIRWCLHNQEPQRISTADPRVEKYQERLPACCHLVPVLFRGQFTTEVCEIALFNLKNEGSQASPGYTFPEGIVIFHIAANIGFKKTIERDHEYKSKTVQQVRENPPM
jgi:hypothetical protein